MAYKIQNQKTASWGWITVPTASTTQVQVQRCFTSTEIIRTIRDGEPRAASSTFTQLLSFELLLVQCCFTSTEAIKTIRDGEPRTATSTFTQLLSSEVVLFVQCCFTFTETIRTISDGEPRMSTSHFHTARELRVAPKNGVGRQLGIFQKMEASQIRQCFPTWLNPRPVA